MAQCDEDMEDVPGEGEFTPYPPHASNLPERFYAGEQSAVPRYTLAPPTAEGLEWCKQLGALPTSTAAVEFFYVDGIKLFPWTIANPAEMQLHDWADLAAACAVARKGLVPKAFSEKARASAMYLLFDGDQCVPAENIPLLFASANPHSSTRERFILAYDALDGPCSNNHAVEPPPFWVRPLPSSLQRGIPTRLFMSVEIWAKEVPNVISSLQEVLPNMKDLTSPSASLIFALTRSQWTDTHATAWTVACRLLSWLIRTVNYDILKDLGLVLHLPVKTSTLVITSTLHFANVEGVHRAIAAALTSDFGAVQAYGTGVDMRRQKILVSVTPLADGRGFDIDSVYNSAVPARTTTPQKTPVVVPFDFDDVSVCGKCTMGIYSALALSNKQVAQSEELAHSAFRFIRHTYIPSIGSFVEDLTETVGSQNVSQTHENRFSWTVKLTEDLEVQCLERNKELSAKLAKEAEEGRSAGAPKQTKKQTAVKNRLSFTVILSVFVPTNGAELRIDARVCYSGIVILRRWVQLAAFDAHGLERFYLLQLLDNLWRCSETNETLRNALRGAIKKHMSAFT